MAHYFRVDALLLRTVLVDGEWCARGYAGGHGYRTFTVVAGRGCFMDVGQLLMRKNLIHEFNVKAKVQCSVQC